MKHAVILAHPDPDSYNAGIARTYAEAARALGHEVILRDLYAMDFDPRLAKDELPWRPGYAPRADVLAERAILSDADVFVFVYPLWFVSPPAMLKGYIDRVMGLHFGFEPRGSASDPRLVGRKFVSITSSGTPEVWLQEEGVMQALTRLFDDNIVAMCGFTLVDHLHFGEITNGITAESVEADFAAVRALVAREFAPLPTA